MGTMVMEDVQRPELGPLPPPSIALSGHGTLHNTGLVLGHRARPGTWSSLLISTTYMQDARSNQNQKSIRGCPHITSAAITRQGQSECLLTLT